MEFLWSDWRFAWRSLGKSPGITPLGRGAEVPDGIAREPGRTVVDPRGDWPLRGRRVFSIDADDGARDPDGLGATSADVTRMLVGEGVTLACVGAAIGIAGASRWPTPFAACCSASGRPTRCPSPARRSVCSSSRRSRASCPRGPPPQSIDCGASRRMTRPGCRGHLGICACRTPIMWSR